MPIASSASRRLRVPHLRDSFIVDKMVASAILFASLISPCLKAQQTLTLSSGAPLTATSTRTTTILHLFGKRIPLKRDNTVAPSSEPTLKLIAELPGKALLFTDTYRSRPMGLSRCRAGEEQFLRLITLIPRPAETFHFKLASCRDNIELADDGLQWSSSVQILTLHWLTPHASKANTLALHIAPNGRAVQTR